MIDTQTETQEVTTIEKSRPEQVVKKTTTVVPPPVRTEHPQSVFEKKKAIFRFYQVVWYLLIVLEIFLGFRLTLKAIGANPLSGFVNLIYSFTDPLTLPFSGVTGQYVSGGTVIEWSTMIAALVYFLIAWGLVYLLQFVKPVTPQEVEEKVDNP